MGPWKKRVRVVLRCRSGAVPGENDSGTILAFQTMLVFRIDQELEDTLLSLCTAMVQVTRAERLGMKAL